jgi:C-terminal processing protease CtpA/Prc
LVIEGKKTIVSVDNRGAAAGSGIRAGDVIQAINGQPADQYDMHAVGAMLTSKPGQTVELTLARDNAEFTAQIQLRPRIDLEALASQPATNRVR